jgi:predicted dehydrogenase
MAPLRLGIAGCGEVTQILHLPSLAMLPDLWEVAALCDVSPVAVEGVANRWQVARRFTDAADLVADPSLDAILVANPDAYHAGTAIAAMDAGKHVLIEKPMCIAPREVDEITAARDRAGVVAQVGYMRRHAPIVGRALELLPNLGPIRLARVHAVVGENHYFVRPTSNVIRATDVPAAVLAEGRDRRRAFLEEALGPAAGPLGGVYGLLLGLNSHDISAMRHLLGRPERVLFAAERPGPCITAAFDYGSFVCQFETALDAIPRFDAHIELFGERQVMRLQYDTPYVRNLPNRLTLTEANGQGGVVQRVEHPAWGDSFVEEWRAFHGHITAGTQPRMTPEDYREDLDIFLEMIRLMS